MRAVITEILSGFPPPASLNEIQSNSFAMNSTTGNCGAAALYACGAIGIRPRAPNHSWRPPFGRRKAYPPSRVRASCVRAYLTALLLAHDLFGDSLFDAGCRLDGKPTRDFLRIFKHIDCAYLAPPQGDHVETWLKYEPPLSSVAVPSHCTNTVVCDGQPFTQILLTLRWRLGRTRPTRSNQRRRVSLSWRSPPIEWAPAKR